MTIEGRLDGSNGSASALADAGLGFVPVRPFLRSGLVARIALAPGDRVLVGAGEAVAPGAPLVERLRDAHLEEVPAELGTDNRRPGERWSGVAPARMRGIRRRAGELSGELLFASSGRWRLAAGEHADLIEAPAAGIVREIRPGTELTLEIGGHALPGALGIGGPSRGRLELATDSAGELRPGGVNVGSAGAILVVGSRVSAETLTRARAMGIRGVVVASLPGKDQRDFAASDARQRAAIHAIPPFAVLVLDGWLRRPIASPVMDLLIALEGRDVAIVGDPPALLFQDPPIAGPPADWIRVRHGPAAGRQGRWLGLAGGRRFPSGTHGEAGFVRFEDDTVAAIPLADLERLA